MVILCFRWEYSTWELVCFDFGNRNRKRNRVSCGEPQKGRILIWYRVHKAETWDCGSGWGRM